MSDLFRTIIVTAADVALSRQIAAGFGPGGVGMWTTGLSATGNAPVTHYISSGLIPATYASLSPNTSWDASGNQIGHHPGSAATVHALALQGGLSVTLADIEGLFSRSDSSEQNPHHAMARLGLKLVDITS